MQKRICASILSIIVFLFAFVALVFAADIQYTYDDLNRLVSVSYGNGNVIRYSYDEAGNRMTRTVSASGSSTAAISPQRAVNAAAH